ncbi:MAG: homoserine dehydrogenase [Candidatus Omnitrophota bacterium]
MNKLNVGLIGFGVVGSGVVKFLTERKKFIARKFDTEFVIKKICDRNIRAINRTGLSKSTVFTTDYNNVINDSEIDVVVELIGGLKPAEEIMMTSLRNGKHVVTANKELLAHKGKELFTEGKERHRDIYFEASVGAGIPIIKSIAEGLAGNKFNGVYGIINGTSNFILSEMTKNECTFDYALKEAQQRGYAESNPTLDISGMDSAHKLAVLIFLAFGKFVDIKDVYTEGISHITHADIEYAQSLNLTIKLLAIAKKSDDRLEARVHPTLIPKNHPLASVNGVFNALLLDTYPTGDVLLYGQGAGQMSAAGGVISDLINLALRHKLKSAARIESLVKENPTLKLKKMDDIEAKFYIRFMAIDKPGILSVISGILGKHGISIASVTQKIHKRSSAVPVFMLTHPAKEKKIRLALEKISRLAIVRSDPVAIRMEKF